MRLYAKLVLRSCVVPFPTEISVRLKVWHRRDGVVLYSEWFRSNIEGAHRKRNEAFVRHSTERSESFGVPMTISVSTLENFLFKFFFKK